MTRTRRPIALFLMLSSLHWLGSSLDLSNPAASSDEDPAVNSRDAPKRPVLQPKETAPPQSTYTLKNLKGQVCVRARLGGEYVVRENKKKYYFNLDPGSTQASGYCLNQKSVLSLSFAGGNLEFTFIKEGNVFYVKKITGLLMPVPTCKNCQNKTYIGIVDHEKLFLAKNGLSFQCKSETTLILSSNLRLKLVPLQIQAFDLASGAFGKEVECWADYNKRVIPIILGGVAAAICLIAILTYVLVRERRGQGYEQL
ncbi:lysosome-associated membrane glycoprotein 3 [Pimephales promelas]|uniref:lysosome-associated membrane glycoprotein 3 n=1 Tax=Pimephales promelas TaxID=90988 RepID=UPI0019557DF9|nr:lysosome-associated membrane glycoprotein 3 [Pimephales promelas]KAG1941980.1 lysosome-associated membrane glycoprotein [Pimephales promelas]